MDDSVCKSSNILNLECIQKIIPSSFTFLNLLVSLRVLLVNLVALNFLQPNGSKELNFILVTLGVE